ncbi:tumor susceptibility gene 101 protein-like [Xenia sp. Carnegie-2017]|uniref:tumor susceptibility gene 101 protein-like n=1 Tax=Xenia sp. Carnegie-2017 TaxID=2897299 RepID=UPI001F04150A|nr:tumor susceptibility gene 101 protein-like [Xenia sp. Carnegie-2017]XP_046844728.1 tumor susceptibility gene 101 protein-like [Xenia sp. Carnegie-2017]XP_046844729.1 tumor susceptibility gene 101 protein-like [Xenia sp. Carnegie-2017]XP_046844730.1 tumor susceptibility gene 101 protein-like [Xenia sp. Carnegie-2017]
MEHFDAFLRTKFKSNGYPNTSQAIPDVKAALENYKTLRPNAKIFANKELVCLEGTIPVVYRGSTYNIPICIWLQKSHPYIPPIVFVVPTPEMEIKVGRHVDTEGRVYLPFLSEWKHPGSDLYQLIQLLCMIFAETPPVFARTKPASHANYQHAGFQPYPPRPNNPLPQGFYQTGPSRMPMPGNAAIRPTHPNIPPYPASTSGAMPQPNRPTPPSRPLPPPIPPPSSRPLPSSRPTPPSRPPPPSNQPYPSHGGFPLPGVPQSETNQPPYPVSQTYLSTQNNPPATTATATGLSRSTQSSFRISSDMMKASIKSGVEDKLRRQLNEVFLQAQTEMDTLKQTEYKLNEGRSKLENMIQQIETEESDVSKDIETLKQKNTEIEDAVKTLQQQSDKVNIDDAVVPTTPLYSQILNLYAEENALDDTMYYLSEALRREKIELDVFLKHVRSLSRKQFMSRALLQKARKRAGLSEL